MNEKTQNPSDMRVPSGWGRAAAVTATTARVWPQGQAARHAG